MIVPLPNIEQMLYGSYRLQFHRKLPAAYYREQLGKMNPFRLTVQRKWQLKQPHPFSQRQHWFENLIAHDEISFCNSLLGRLAMETDPVHRHYLLHEAKKQLLSLMKAIQLLSENLAGTPIDSETELSDAEEQRLQHEEKELIDRLKACVAGLYLDVQEIDPQMTGDHPVLDEAAIYRYYYLEESPSISLLMPAENCVLPLPRTKVSEGFLPMRHDREGQILRKVCFKDIIDTEKLFALEEILFEYEMIDINSCFIKNRARSNKKLMAVVYRKIIDVGIFRKHSLNKKQNIKENDIRVYLDKRYQTDISQEFRKLNEKDMEQARIKLPFLEYDARFR